MAQSSLENVSEQVFTEKTIRKMYDLIQRGKTDERFQKLVYGVVNQAMPGQWKDYRRELATIFDWDKRKVNYRRDPYGVELVQDVWATLDRARGDCDDFTVLLCTGAEILGAPCRIVTVSTRRDREPNHVYPEALVGGQWLAMDATVPGSSLGWRPPNVTDRRVWTRRDVGLSGDEDLSGIEGLGMTHENGYGQNGFLTDMFPVSQILAPGVPDDISDTYAGPIPGDTATSRRVIHQSPVTNVSDRTSNPRAGGGVFQPALPIRSMPTPSELWSTVKRDLVPRVLDPDSAWWGKVPTSKEDFRRMFPGSEESMENYMRDVASVPASAIDELANDVAQQVRMGMVDTDLDTAIGEALEDFALGAPPRMKRPGKGRIVKKPGSRAPIKQPMPPPLLERRYLVPAPASTLVRVEGGPLNGLGSLIDDVVSMVSSAVSTGKIPTDEASIKAAIDQAAAAAAEAEKAKMRQPVTTLSVAKAGIPIGMLALLGGAALLLGRTGKKSRYRSNPSRRRSRGRGRRGGGLDMKTMLMFAAAGGAAWYFLLRPGAALLPGAPRPTTSVPPVPKPPSTAQQVAAGVIKAAPSLFDTIKNLFSPSSVTTDYSTTGAQPVPGIVTSLPESSAPSETQSSGFVTSYA